MSASDKQPPWLARVLFRLLVRTDSREFILGDIEEEFHDDHLPRLGYGPARRRYWRNVLGSLRETRAHPSTLPPETPRRGNLMDNATQNLRFTLRSWLKQPAVTLTALLALGIGANAAIFSVVYGVLLNPLGYPRANELMTVWLDNNLQGWHQDVTSWDNFVDWREMNTTFADMAAIVPTDDNLTGSGDPERVSSQVVSPTFFDILGVEPRMGRGFAASDWDTDERVVVLSHGSWQRRFAADTEILGTTIELNGIAHTVIGVMPTGFHYMMEEAQHWRLFGREIQESGRGQLFLQVVGRLNPGVAHAQAQADLDRVGERLAQEYPDSNSGYGVNIVPVYEEVVGDVRPALLVLLGAVGLVLLICCANVANLMLVRATTRRREMAIRAALGAGRRRLLGQVMSESMMLSLAGALLGLVVAYGGVRLLRTMEPDLPRLAEIGLQWPVLGFTLAAAALTGFVFGLAPALHAAGTDLARVLGDRGGTDSSRSVGRLRTGLAVAEIALALVLITGAGLLLRSYSALIDHGPGFDTEDALTFRVSLSGPNYQSGDDARGYFEEAFRRLRSLPGVDSVAGVSSLPLGVNYSSGPFTIEGRPPQDRSQLREVKMNIVTPGYFRTMRISQVAGRSFDDNDTRDAEFVVVINDALASAYFPGEDPVGHRFLFGIPDYYVTEEDPDPDLPWGRIIGVVAGNRHRGLDQPIEPEVFTVYDQSPRGTLSFVMRTKGDALALAPAARSELWAIDADLPIASLGALGEHVQGTTRARRFNLTLLGLFAGIALILAVTGLYGVISYWVTQQTREIGVRMALGARGTDVMWMILARTGLMIGAGITLGVLGALALTRLMSSLLYGVDSTDPATFAAVASLLLVTAFIASAVPARRATRIDPIEALRDD